MGVVAGELAERLAQSAAEHVDAARLVDHRDEVGVGELGEGPGRKGGHQRTFGGVVAERRCRRDTEAFGAGAQSDRLDAELRGDLVDRIEQRFGQVAVVVAGLGRCHGHISSTKVNIVNFFAAPS